MNPEPIRIWRSPYSSFLQEETLHAAEKYTPAVLADIAAAGFNAIWIHAFLREVVRSPVYPALGAKSAANLRSLRTVIRRAEKVGLKVFLYMQPPRGMHVDDPFWEKHPEARGSLNDSIHERAYAMCTSEPKVKEHLRGCAEALSRKLPSLGGVILITASEFQAHCYSKYRVPSRRELDYGDATPLDCPRCAERHPSDVVAEVITIFSDAFKAAGNGARVIAWNWSWTMYEPDPGKRVIGQLPKDVTLLVGFERGAKKTILGKRRVIDEYSLSYPGPSPRFMKAMKTARGRGLDVMAKLQLGVTHELATVPNLALIGSLYEKAKGMRSERVHSFMGCWNFGNMLTANTAAFTQFMTAKRLPPRERALRQFASAYFPGCDATAVVEAWDTFAGAMNFYPFCIPFLYWSPTNYAVRLPIEPKRLTGKPVGRSWMDDERGDDVVHSLGAYTLTEVIRGLGRLAKLWEQGAERLAEGLAACDAPTARDELNTAYVAGSCFHSAWNIYRAYRLRRNWKAAHKAKLLPIMKDELAHLERVLPIVAADSRMGYHSECQAFLFDAKRIRAKIRKLRADTR